MKLDLFHVRPRCDHMVKIGLTDPKAIDVINTYVLTERTFTDQLRAMRAITARNPRIMKTLAFALWVRNNDEKLIRFVERNPDIGGF